MMEFDDRQQYGVSKKRLLGVLSDHVFVERKLKLLGAWKIAWLAHETDAAHSHLQMRYHRNADARIPAFARKFVAERVEVTQTEDWDFKTGQGRLTVEVKNLPMRMAAKMRVQARKGGAEHLLEWTLHCPLPLIGRTLEKLAADEMAKKFAQDGDAVRQLLAQRAPRA
jgi:hypothetical protein